MNIKLKNLILQPIFRKILQIGDQSIGSILTLHRVNNIDPDKIYYNEHLKVSPEFLEMLIKKLRKEKFSFVSIDELFEILTKKIPAKNLLVFTLDDGYKDNYENALSVFKQYSVPFIIYISTSFPEKQMIFWWYLLEDIILQNDKIVLDTGEIFNCQNRSEKEATFLSIREKILSLNPNTYNESLPRLFSKYSFDSAEYNQTLPLSWNEIKVISTDPMGTIGNHTHAHIALKSSSVIEIKEDIEYSNQLFEKHLGSRPLHFCYPFGDSVTISSTEIELVSKMGFKTAVTTDNGNIYKKHVNSLYSLPRIFVSEHQQPDLIKTLTLMKLKQQ